MNRSVLNAILSAVLVIGFMVSISCAKTPKGRGYSLEKIGTMEKELKMYTDERTEVEKNLETFNTLDYTVFSNQEWTRLSESHSKDVIVHWSDGHQTNSLEKHIEDLKAIFVYAPDAKIKVHLVKFGSGGFTCVTSIISGTFSRPMPAGEGKFIQPTGKVFFINLCMVGKWKDGVMIEKWIFWDNKDFMKQIGIGQ